MNSQVSTTFGFYAILTDPFRGYDFCTRLMVEHKIAFVQLRMKDASDDDIIEVARRMRKITQGTATRFIVNDNPHIAKLVDADGVHLGQSDMAHEDARLILGKEAIIGISTHSQQQALDACRLMPDYIGMGPVYPTPTKKNADPAIGLDGLRRMAAVAAAKGLPAVALGSITAENLPAILAAGARNFSCVRPITQSPDPASELKKILAVYSQCSAIEQCNPVHHETY